MREAGFMVLTLRYFLMRVLGCVLFVLTGFLCSKASAQTNSWINSGDGAWQDTNNWSLSQAPTNTQSLLVTNAGSKTVLIDASSVAATSSNLAGYDLTVSAVGGATN